MMKAVENLTFGIRDGEFVSIIGPSGCGKTTTVNMIAGFEKPSVGTLEFDGKPIPGPSLERVVVFQEHSLFPWLTVRENVAFGLECMGAKKKDICEVASRKIELVGLSEFADEYPYQLSGGMKQRTSIARALTLNPRVLILDEPFGALDAITRHMLISEMERILLMEKRTIIFVTHSIIDAVQISDRILVMSKHPGTIVADMRIDIPRPRDSIDDKFIELRREVLLRLE